MIFLGRVEVSAGLDLGRDRCIENMRLVELGDVGLGNARLLRIGREDGRAILRPDIRPLVVELGWIMGD